MNDEKDWLERIRKKTYQKWADEGDYKSLLQELLAVIHRDGGQYTMLTGFATSTEDAIKRVYEIRTRLIEAKRRR